MKKFLFSSLGVAVAVAALLLSTSALTAQVIITNSSVTYTYEANPLNTLLPGAPITVATPDSTLSFYPTDTFGSVASAAWDIGTLSAVVSIAMDANPGHWFSGTALALTSTVSYTLSAPSAASEVGLTTDFPFILSVTSVDHAPFANPTLQLATNMTMSQPYVVITGPLNFQSGYIYGSSELDINSIKTHFGIGATNNVTGMRLKLSLSGTAWAQEGSASGSLAKFDLANQIAVVPEPSTYALLALTATALGAGFLRRRS